MSISSHGRQPPKNPPSDPPRPNFSAPTIAMDPARVRACQREAKRLARAGCKMHPPSGPAPASGTPLDPSRAERHASQPPQASQASSAVPRAGRHTSLPPQPSQSQSQTDNSFYHTAQGYSSGSQWQAPSPGGSVTQYTPDTTALSELLHQQGRLASSLTLEDFYRPAQAPSSKDKDKGKARGWYSDRLEIPDSQDLASKQDKGKSKAREFYSDSYYETARPRQRSVIPDSQEDSDYELVGDPTPTNSPPDTPRARPPQPPTSDESEEDNQWAQRARYDSPASFHSYDTRGTISSPIIPRSNTGSPLRVTPPPSQPPPIPPRPRRNREQERQAAENYLFYQKGQDAGFLRAEAKYVPLFDYQGFYEHQEAIRRQLRGVSTPFDTLKLPC